MTSNRIYMDLGNRPCTKRSTSSLGNVPRFPGCRLGRTRFAKPSMSEYKPSGKRVNGSAESELFTDTESSSKDDERLTRSFIFCVCGGRTQKGGRQAPLMKPQTARRHRPATATTDATATVTAYRTTTVHYHSDRMEEGTLSLREVRPNEVIA